MPGSNHQAYKNALKKVMATVKDTAKRVSGGVEYRGKKYPGFNKPMQYRGSGKFKKTVLAKKGNEVKVVNFGHKGYGHNYSSKARSPILHDLLELETKAGGLQRMR